MLDDLVIFQKTYDFLLWINPAINKFPKNQKFVLGQKTELKILELMHSMILANNASEKSEHMKQAGVELDELRVLIRLAKDLRYISIKKYETAAEKMNEIGRLLTGWMNRFI